MRKDEDRSWILLLALLGLAVWQYGGSRSAPSEEQPFEEVFSEIRGVTGITYATDRGIFFLTNEKHDLGPGLWFEILESGEMAGPIGVRQET